MFKKKKNLGATDLLFSLKVRSKLNTLCFMACFTVTVLPIKKVVHIYQPFGAKYSGKNIRFFVAVSFPLPTIALVDKRGTVERLRSPLIWLNLMFRDNTNRLLSKKIDLRVKEPFLNQSNLDLNLDSTTPAV